MSLSHHLPPLTGLQISAQEPATSGINTASEKAQTAPSKTEAAKKGGQEEEEQEEQEEQETLTVAATKVHRMMQIQTANHRVSL